MRRASTMTSAPSAPWDRSFHMKPNRSCPGVPNRYSFRSSSMVMQPKSSATVVDVLAGTSVVRSSCAATEVIAASVVSGGISEIADTVVVLPTPKPPAMTIFTGTGGRCAPDSGSADGFQSTDHPFDQVPVVRKWGVRALDEQVTQRGEVGHEHPCDADVQPESGGDLGHGYRGLAPRADLGGEDLCLDLQRVVDRLRPSGGEQVRPQTGDGAAVRRTGVALGRRLVASAPGGGHVQSAPDGELEFLDEPGGQGHAGPVGELGHFEGNGTEARLLRGENPQGATDADGAHEQVPLGQLDDHLVGLAQRVAVGHPVGEAEHRRADRGEPVGAGAFQARRHGDQQAVRGDRDRRPYARGFLREASHQPVEVLRFEADSGCGRGHSVPSFRVPGGWSWVVGPVGQSALARPAANPSKVARSASGSRIGAVMTRRAGLSGATSRRPGARLAPGVRRDSDAEPSPVGICGPLSARATAVWKASIVVRAADASCRGALAGTDSGGRPTAAGRCAPGTRRWSPPRGSALGPASRAGIAPARRGSTCVSSTSMAMSPRTSMGTDVPPLFGANHANGPGTAGIAGTATSGAARAGRRADPAPAGMVDAAAGGAAAVAACSADGIESVAVVPPPSVGSSSTASPCRRASRPTTNSPSTLVGTMSSRSRSTSRRFSSASRSADIPMPWSTMLTWHHPSAVRIAETSTVDSGGENEVAFSSSSANTSTRSDARDAAIVASCTAPNRTR